ncbi:aminodeoxychorismate/anthranilate synthase component II [Fulvivirgaceae bacterium PWU5]|uniref:Aminodeoxychorismate/anthranilate synthase component II n=1 Tax=Dawidia cretensis TaxID=2782350 RepID=A0AAP2GVX4_9BACT|nr:aminodeoxychorismate/anthranilate synthase component II [Dawidia cretensis]MBT1711300.1 aminodeoxychorismate/anthranilate synthase component II [Dawidia cretensis]
MKLLVIDNYDSFTYNLVHIIRELKYAVDIVRNDKISVEAVKQYDKILLSPGPGIPDEAGIMKAVVREYGPSKSILGVCLGHQGIGEVYGATLYNIPRVLHGVTSQVEIKDTDEYMFQGVSPVFQATHYHSWAVMPQSFTPELKITATNNEGLVMALRHTRYDVRGVQFHPESIMTPEGPKMIENWLKH